MNIAINLNFLQGIAYGYKRPILKIAFETTRNNLNSSVEDFHTILEVLFDEEIDNAYSLDTICEVILYIVAIQYKKAKIPIFNTYKIISSIEKEDKVVITYGFDYFHQRTFRIALDFAIVFVDNMVRNIILDKELMVQNISKIKAYFHQGVNHIRFLQAAHHLNIPFRQYLENIYIFGNGKNSFLLESTITEKTNKIGTHIASNKFLTNKLLHSFGLPVPKQVSVGNVTQALEVASNIGYPVVCKPAELEGGMGVFSGLVDSKALESAYYESATFSKNIVIEKHIFGQDYRITVFQGKVIKTILRIPGGVTGDGKHTIKELIAISQENPQIKRRSKEKGYQILCLDNEAKSLLHQYSIDESCILQKGEFFPLRRKANAYTGGITRLVAPNQIHPDNIALAIRVARILKIDIVGIDLIIQDIALSYLETECGICEVNASPQIGNSDTPCIYEDIINELVPNKGEIPIIVSYGDKEESIKLPNVSIGKYYKKSVSIGDAIIAKKSSLFDGCRALINSDDVEILLCSSTNESDFINGLPFCRYTILVLFEYHDGLQNILDNASYIVVAKNISSEVHLKKYTSCIVFKNKNELQKIIFDILKMEKK